MLIQKLLLVGLVELSDGLGGLGATEPGHREVEEDQGVERALLLNHEVFETLLDHLYSLIAAKSKVALTFDLSD